MRALELLAVLSLTVLANGLIYPNYSKTDLTWANETLCIFKDCDIWGKKGCWTINATVNTSEFESKGFIAIANYLAALNKTCGGAGTCNPLDLAKWHLDHALRERLYCVVWNDFKGLGIYYERNFQVDEIERLQEELAKGKLVILEQYNGEWMYYLVLDFDRYNWQFSLINPFGRFEKLRTIQGTVHVLNYSSPALNMDLKTFLPQQFLFGKSFVVEGIIESPMI
eukprot:TRINITY_DN48_c0_g1_i1.p1 TRINITY_DN48_c0_g1~~TRINITY_DN48_c0_g1_i1.p1  ORF type:complete len:225 (-),score=21.79 TRINITY_DN48_c0_g1_i1:189-863(-)